MEEQTPNRFGFETEEEKSGTYQGVGGFILEIIKIIVLAFVIILPIRVFLFQPFFVQGASMEPNFENGEYLIINEFGYKETNVGIGSWDMFKVKPFKKIERNRAIVFRYPLDKSKFFIKRVIGLPGEKLEIKSGKIKIYNEDNPEGLELDETGHLSFGTKTIPDLVVSLGADDYFVMGDNRTQSLDSRAWGPVKKSEIMGAVLVRAWPLDKISVY